MSAGFGVTPNSLIVALPQVLTAGEEFTVQITGINKFGQPYLSPEDPTLVVFQLDFVH